MNTEKIEKDIATLKKMIDNKSIPDDIKKDARKTLAKLEADLESSREPKKEKSEPAEKPVKSPAKKSGKKKKPIKKAVTTTSGHYDKEDDSFHTKEKSKSPKRSHKKKPAGEVPSCDELVERFEARREAARQAAGKAKTKSIFDKVTDKVEGAVVAAIKNVPAEDIKDDPKKKIKEFEELNDAAIAFTEKFKAVMGDEFEKGEAKKAFEGLHKLIQSLKKKYTGQE